MADEGTVRIAFEYTGWAAAISVSFDDDGDPFPEDGAAGRLRPEQELALVSEIAAAMAKAFSQKDLYEALAAVTQHAVEMQNERDDARRGLSGALAEREDARRDAENLREALAIALALASHESAPAIGVDVGEAGGGGGSEPPPPLPEPDTETRRGWQEMAARYGAEMERPLIMDSPLMDDDLPGVPSWESVREAARTNPGLSLVVHGGGEPEPPAQGKPTSPPRREPSDAPLSEVDPAAVDAVASMVANTSDGLPPGFRCEYCPRGFATEAGRNRHVGQAHRRQARINREAAAGLTVEQKAARAALVEGDPVSMDLVDCGVPGCTARRSADAIGRHRLSMHGVG